MEAHVGRRRDSYTEPYESSSTPQDMEVRKFSYGLLAGAADSPVTLTFKDKDGKTWDRTIARKGYRNLKPWKSYEWRVIGKIGYLALNDFEHYKLVHVVDSLFPAIEQTSGLVIDVRMNGGGSSNIGWAILSMLTDKSSPTGGGGSARVCSKRDTYPDGSEFIGTGVHPTVTVEPTIMDFRAGTDVAVQKAIELVSPKTTAVK